MPCPRNISTKGKGKIVAEHDYRDADGNLVYQLVRLDPKDFRQRRPNGDGWLWNMDGVTRVPYRLPELLAADPKEPVFVVEGEKDVERLRSLGLIATWNGGGAGKWRKSYGKYFEHRAVVIVPENNEAGRDRAEMVAASLRGVAASIKIVTLPDLADNGDVSDWLDAGGTAEKLHELVDTAEEWVSDSSRPFPRKRTTNRGRGSSQAMLLVGMAEDDVEPFHTPDGDAYATITVDQHHEHWAVRSKPFRHWLARRYYYALDDTPSPQAMQDAIGVLEGKASFDGAECSVYVRVAGYGDKVYLDLCNRCWQTVEIDAGGWRIVDHCPVKFRRAKAMLPLPEPTEGTFGDLRRFVNVTDEQWPLVAGFAVGALQPTGPYPLLSLAGEQGSAKTTAMRLIRSCIDPNSAPVRAEPREPRDLMIAARNGWLVALDNLSHLRNWLSDALCRLSTGGGFSTRTLYENDEETIFHATRPVMLTGIEEVPSRGDLIDRSLLVSLPAIPEGRRRPEADLWREFEEARPRILGGLLTAVSTAIRNLPKTKLDRLPRMADFALWATAAEPALGLSSGEFLDAYAGNREEANDLALEASPVAKLLQELPETWEGTAAELLAKLEKVATDGMKRLKSWPASARSMGGTLKRLAPNLRVAGVNVDFWREAGGKRTRMITIRRSTGSCVPAVETQEAGRDANGTQAGRKTQDETGEKPLDGTQRDDRDAKIPTFSNGHEGVLV